MDQLLNRAAANDYLVATVGAENDDGLYEAVRGASGWPLLASMVYQRSLHYAGTVGFTPLHSVARSLAGLVYYLGVPLCCRGSKCET